MHVSIPPFIEAGHNAWGYGISDTLLKELDRDFINRCVQIELLKTLKKLFPLGQQIRDEFHINEYVVSLVGGHWRVGNTTYPLSGSYLAKRDFDSNSGPNPESLSARFYGIPLKMAAPEMARRASITVGHACRYLQHKLPGYSRVVSFRIEYKRGTLCGDKYPYAYHATYAYTTLDGSFSSFVEYLILEGFPGFLKLPVTLWRNQYGRQHLDYLHPEPPFPLYNLYPLGQSPNSPALVCADEAQVEYIRKMHSWMQSHTELTTWSGGLECSIEGTDWGYLQGRPGVTIWAGSTKDSLSRAYKVYRALRKAGVQKVSFLIAYAGLEAGEYDDEARQTALAKDLVRAYLHGEIQSKAQFLAEASRLFGLRLEAEQEITAISARDLLALTEATPEYVLFPVLVRGDKAMLCAPRGSGKSWLVMALALLIASGGSLFDGRLSCPRPLRVLIIDGEMKLRVLRSRMGKLLTSLGGSSESLNNLRIIALAEHGQKIRLDTPDGLARLKNDIAWADVIFADSLYCLWPSAMSNQIEGCQALNDFMAECSRQGKTVIIVDHTGRDKKGSYGTSGKEFGLDLMWMLKKPRKDQDRFQLEVTKGRNLSSAETPSFVFDLIEDKADKCVRLEFVKAGQQSLPAPKTNLALPAAESEAQDVPEPALPGEMEVTLDDLDRQILELNKENPELSGQKIGKRLGKSNSTVAARITKLKEAELWIYSTPEQQRIAVPSRKKTKGGI
jgi:biotin operon repressor